VDGLRVRQREAVEAVLRLKLLAWLLHAEVADAVRALLAEVQCPPAWQHQPAGAVSTWRLTDLSLTTLRQQVQGTWTRARVVACLPRLRRFVGESGRQRLQQETALRRWLTGQERPVVPLLRAAA
jgi:hypothetical protein